MFSDFFSGGLGEEVRGAKEKRERGEKGSRARRPEVLRLCRGST